MNSPSSFPPKSQHAAYEVSLRKRMRWTHELHSLFEQAVRKLQADHVPVGPKPIRATMTAFDPVRMGSANVSILHIKSHLQKWRLLNNVAPSRRRRSNKVNQNSVEISGTATIPADLLALAPSSSASSRRQSTRRRVMSYVEPEDDDEEEDTVEEQEDEDEEYVEEEAGEEEEEEEEDDEDQVLTSPYLQQQQQQPSLLFNQMQPASSSSSSSWAAGGYATQQQQPQPQQQRPFFAAAPPAASHYNYPPPPPSRYQNHTFASYLQAPAAATSTTGNRLPPPTDSFCMAPLDSHSVDDVSSPHPHLPLHGAGASSTMPRTPVKAELAELARTSPQAAHWLRMGYDMGRKAREGGSDADSTAANTGPYSTPFSITSGLVSSPLLPAPSYHHHHHHHHRSGAGPRSAPSSATSTPVASSLFSASPAIISTPLSPPSHISSSYTPTHNPLLFSPAMHPFYTDDVLNAAAGAGADSAGLTDFELDFC